MLNLDEDVLFALRLAYAHLLGFRCITGKSNEWTDDDENAFLKVGEAIAAMKEAHIVFVTNEDDWEGVYVNGVLLDQGHHIRKEFMIGQLVGSVIKSVKTQLVDNEWLYEEGGLLPYKLSDVVLGKLGD